jgi:glycosyltransferase involved in cell wall biosynthesis
MYKNKKIGVVVPTYNEERFIAGVIETMPEFVDRIYVVDDSSTDRTAVIIDEKARQLSRVLAIHRRVRGGVGAAILSGHNEALKDNMDIMAVMAGDGQMDPSILSEFLDPIIEDRADYVKGNRLSSRDHRREMPGWIVFGNFCLSFVSKIATGYYNIMDSQDGYTAISAEMLRKLDLQNMEKGYAFENDMLVNLNVFRARVADLAHPAVYRGQRSKIRYYTFVIKISWVLFRDFWRRLWKKYFAPAGAATLRKTA